MTDDIVTRLREEQAEEKQLGNDLLAEVLWDAADEIERLRADRDRWRRVAELFLLALGVPTNETDRFAVREYERAVRGE